MKEMIFIKRGIDFYQEDSALILFYELVKK